MEESGDAAGIAVVLGELRSEYYQIRKAELLMQRHRDTWMRSVEHWLDNQARAMKLPSDGAIWPTSRGKHGRKVRALPQLPLEATEAGQLGPQRPCPPPAPIDADELEDALDASQVEPKFDASVAFEEADGASKKVCRAGTVEEPRPSKKSTISRGAIFASEESEAHAQGRRMSLAHERLCSTADRRFKSWRRWKSNQHTTEETAWTTQRVVDHPLFDSTCAIMIALNSVIIGLEVERQAQGEREEATLLKASGYVCSIFFIVELVLRMWTQGKKYFCNENRGWNIFDLSLVVLSIVDAIIEFGTSPGTSRSSMATGMKTVKMLRIVRVFRVFRFFRELSLLALMIVDSTANLGWAIILLALIIYVFAILFTSEAASYINEHGMDDDYDDRVAALKNWFGNLPRTIYSLVQAMLGGVSWGVCSDSLLHLSVLACGLFIFYVAFTILAVMNVVTGVFVDNAVETARTTRDFLIAKELELKEKYASEMRDLFIEMDKDGSGTVGLEEIKEYLEDPRVQAFFNTLGLDTNDTERLFKLIDDDGSGDVDVGEFLDGCLRLKGQARSLDVYAIMHDLKSLEGKVDTMTSALQAQALASSPLGGPYWPQRRMQKGRTFQEYAPENAALTGGGGYELQHSPSLSQPQVTSTSVSAAATAGESQASRSSTWVSSSQAPAPSRTPQVVTVTTTATATLM